MRNTTTLIFIGLIVLAGAWFVFSNNSSVNGNTIKEPNVAVGEMQKVVLSQEGYNYKDAVVEAGKPISISADDSVRGCLRSVAFNLEGKRYSKYLQSSSDTLQLPALSKGTYQYSCSMGMGFGKLIVE